MDRLVSFGRVRSVDAQRNRVTQVISTGDLARDGAIIDPRGWDFTNYDRNPVVLWMHDADVVPFARTIRHVATDSELIAEAEFDLEDPRGAQAFSKIRRGYINATSVRWLPIRTERRPAPEGVKVPDHHKDPDGNVLWFMEQELLEFSYVSIPADPGALIIRADGRPFNVRDFASASGGFAPLERLATLLERFAERRGKQPSLEDVFVSALARATGKSRETIRREMAA
jgi:phage head maturation protease